ncbi:phospholipase/Carboxylesterase [Methylobacterium sp. 4-46]|uniref:alpha/beta hydrolase n=1 Tax=unclassified Methylobacterium TaxID=2615210 RepID=UPI000152DD9C|nr:MULTISPECIES: PHB depolymerase family esterase [Methylobacterium]ACA14650.1 phospholipase/Carboxylesterase [Methylobacterium sp. 4-46]WFT80403.1 alpha/beta hydrolase-fold protein [Methylobacterium nodulans]
MPEAAAHAQGILMARPDAAAGPGLPAGTNAIGLGGTRDGLVQVPGVAPPGRRPPLLVMLHGAGASSADVLPMVASCAEQHAVVVLVPDSRGATWDLIQRGYGPDVAFLDAALGRLFARQAVDPARIAVAGFSDGASYALSLGLANGSLFGDVLAFSPGFCAPARREGTPRIFLSHGREDPVLPFARCGDRVAGALARDGYDVAYRPFSGGHAVPSPLVAEAFRRFLA